MKSELDKSVCLSFAISFSFFMIMSARVMVNTRRLFCRCSDLRELSHIDLHHLLSFQSGPS